MAENGRRGRHAVRVDADGRMLDVRAGLTRLPLAAAACADLDAVWLFGSYGTARQTPLSDVDIAVLPAVGTSRSLDSALTHEVRLQEVLGTDAIDVVWMDAAPLWLQAEVASSGRLLYVRDPVRLADYLEVLWRRWGDFQIDWLAFQAEAARALREAVADGR